MAGIRNRWWATGIALVFGVHVATAQCEVGEFSSSDAQSGDYFGGTVDVDGERALVGAVADELGGVELGSAYVFERAGGGWNQAAKLVGSDSASSDQFGSVVALDGDRAIVGARGHGHFGQGAGSAYLFERTAGAWIETAELGASDAQPGDFFGWAVSISGSTAVVGAIFEDGLSDSVGAVYVYDLQGASWVQTAKLVASDGGTSQRFGASVSIVGDRLLVGALAAGGVAVASGAVYVFERQAGVWVETAKLSPSDGASSDHFGVTVDQSGDRVLVGQQAGDAGDLSGSAYVYDLQAGSWVESAKLISSDQQPFDFFGASLALTGDTAFVGAAFFRWDAGIPTGAVYAFERVGSAWHETQKLQPADIQVGDVFGKALAADGDIVLIGATGGETAVVDSGTVYEFGAATFATLYCLCPMSGPCGNDDSEAGCANSTAFGARFSACGSPGVSNDDLALSVSGLPANVFGIVYSGANAVSIPFGDGVRCVGQGLVRFPVQDSGPGGSFSQTHLASLGGFVAGQTRRFQAWYRDPLGPCGTGFNLSNGVSLVFTP